MPPVDVDVSRLRAIVVGVERFAHSNEATDLNGPALDACRIVAWLRDTGVPTDRITALISPFQRNEMAVEAAIGRGYGPATFSRIREALIEDVGDASALFVYLAGTGIEMEHGPGLLCADTTVATPSAIDLTAMARYLAAFGPRTQLVLVDACRNWVPFWIPPSDHPYPTGGTDQGTQYLIHACSSGNTTRNDDREHAGVFTRQALRALQTVGTSPWWTTIPQVHAGLLEHFVTKAEYDDEQRPEFRTTDPVRSWVQVVPLVRGQSQAPVGAFRMAASWNSATQPLPLDERYAISLDVLLCLDRTLRLAVVADATGHSLTGPLNAAEDCLAPLWGDVRRWIEADRSVRDPSGRRALEVAGGRPTLGAPPPGVVLRVAAEDSGQITALLAGLRRSGVPPESPVVVQTVADRLIDAARGGCSAAGRLGLAEIVIRSVPPRPSGANDGGSAPHAGGEAGRVLAHLRDVVPAGWLARLPRPAPPAARGLDDRNLGFDPTAVVEDLNEGDGWGTATEEATVLRALRDHQPNTYAALLPALAVARSHPRRHVALSVAARTDAELDVWFAQPQDNPVTPGATVPRHMVSTATADAVTLAIIRNYLGSDALAPWQQLTSPAVRSVCDHHLATRHCPDRATADAAFLSAADLETATGAIRAGVGADLALDAIPGSAESPACWRLLSRRRLDADTVEWVRSWPEGLGAFLRLGLARAPFGTQDEQLACDLSDLREALIPTVPPTDQEE
jgi:hypothetical protein